MPFIDNLNRIRETVTAVQNRSGMNGDIVLVAVTKTFPSEIVRTAIASGVSDIAENRVQEAEKKFSEIGDLRFTRHLVGHLQSNKAAKAAALFDWIQSIDDYETAQKLDRKLADLGRSINVLIEVNTSGDSNKNGIRPEEAEELAGKLLELSRLKIRGLMTIGPFGQPPEAARECFRRLFRLRDQLRQSMKNVNWDHLSMGMSDDYPVAIEEGSTMIRLGRALFGER